MSRAPPTQKPVDPSPLIDIGKLIKQAFKNVDSPASTPGSKETDETFTHQAEGSSQDLRPCGNEDGYVISIPVSTSLDQTVPRKKFKKDALWKPLLRSFRTFLRKMIRVNFDSSMRMFYPNGNLRKHVKK